MNDVTLIQYYRPAASVVEARAEQVRDRLPAIRGLSGQVEKDHRNVIDHVAGDLKSSMANAPRIAVLTSGNATQKAEFAAGCLELFSKRIDEHNHLKAGRPRSVSRLNAEYNTALDNKFGITVHEPGPNATTDQWDQAWDGFWKDFAAKKSALVHDLRQEAAELDAWLDRRADEIGAMLRRGPNTEDVRKLWRAGALTPYAPLVFPGADLATIKLSPDAQRELLEDLIANPELLMAMPSALQAVVDRLPQDVRTKVYVEQRMAHLREQGLLTGPNPGGKYEQWIRNTYLNGVPISTVVAIARDHDIRPDDFDVLNGLKEIKDRDQKSFFLLPTNISGADARKAVLMTYILNAGTGYQVDPSTGNVNLEYSPTPYRSAEVQRIIDRQNANSWSYDQYMENFHDEGGRVVATPNGMLIGAGNSWQQDARTSVLKEFGSGGVCVGDLFMPTQTPDDPARWLETVISRGTAPNDPRNVLDLDRLLHHEERHSQQWAREGPGWFLYHYLTDHEKYEKDAGRSDGGYTAP